MMMMMKPLPHLLTLLFLLFTPGSVKGVDYHGKKIGALSSLFHEVNGDVYAVDSNSIHIRNFKYDGAAPDAYFWAGSTAEPSAEGFIIPDEKGTNEVLQPYNNRHVTLQLPDGKTLKDIKWISVWCRKFRANFGHILIPDDFVPPAPLNLGPLPGVEHDMSSGDVVVVDAQTFMVPNFTLDGLAPDAHFWVGKGTPSPEGTLVGDENGSDKPLGRYDKKSLVISLPSNVTVFDIDYFGVWCIIAAADFGHLKMPSELNVPPSPQMLGQSVKNKLNCELLNENPRVEVRWVLRNNHIIFQLASRIDEGDYMSFGLSGEPHRSAMINGDVTVAWIDKEKKGHAVDYYMDTKAQCAGGRGVCPDNRIVPNSDNVQFLSASEKDGLHIVTYQRLLETGDPLDNSFIKSQPQAVIWALGPLNSLNEASYHYLRTSGNKFIFFNRHPSWNCPSKGNENNLMRHRPHSIPAKDSIPLPATPLPVPPPTIDVPLPPLAPDSFAENSTSRWFIPPIECDEPADGVFYAQMGPTGGKNGYAAITGNVGWGIAWYINGLLIPEITVVRGRTYRFVIEGGGDPSAPSRNHPFYITDDPIGGYGTKTAAEKTNVRIFAGVEETKDGLQPTGHGRLCQWVSKETRPADEYESFGEFQRQLELRCGEGKPGMLAWTPDADTPDIVYYQCFTHRFLGWKIHVVDSCDKDPIPEATFMHEIRVPPPKGMHFEAPLQVKNKLDDSHIFHSVSSFDSSYPLTFDETDVAHVRVAAKYITSPKGAAEKRTNNDTTDIKKGLNRSIKWHNEKKIHYQNNPEVVSGKLTTMGNTYNQVTTSEFLQDPLEAEASEENPVVFRAQGGRNIPPLPANLPFTKTTPRRPPIFREVKAEGYPISYDGSPVKNAHFSSAQPTGPKSDSKTKPTLSIMYTRQYGPYKGNKPPPVPEHVPRLPQFQQRVPPLSQASRDMAAPKTSETEYAILNNIWSIISSQE